MTFVDPLDDWAALPLALVDPLDDVFQPEPFEPLGSRIHTQMPADLVLHIIAPLVYSFDDLLKAIRNKDPRMVQFLLRMPSIWTEKSEKDRLSAIECAIVHSLNIFQMLYEKDPSTVHLNWEQLLWFAVYKNRHEVIHFMLQDLKRADGVLLEVPQLHDCSTEPCTTQIKSSEVFSRWDHVNWLVAGSKALKTFIGCLTKDEFAWLVQDGIMEAFENDVNAVFTMAVWCNNLDVVHHCVHVLGANALWLSDSVMPELTYKNLFVQKNRDEMALYLLVHGASWRKGPKLDELLQEALTPRVMDMILEAVDLSLLEFHITHYNRATAKFVHIMLQSKVELDYAHLAILSLEAENYEMGEYFMHLMTESQCKRWDDGIQKVLGSETCSEWLYKLNKCVKWGFLNIPTVASYSRVSQEWEACFGTDIPHLLSFVFPDRYELSFDLTEVFVREVLADHRFVHPKVDSNPYDAPEHRLVGIFIRDLCTLRRYLISAGDRGRKAVAFLEAVEHMQRKLADGKKLCSELKYQVCCKGEPYEGCKHKSFTSKVTHSCALCKSEFTVEVRCKNYSWQ